MRRRKPLLSVVRALISLLYCALPFSVSATYSIAANEGWSQTGGPLGGVVSSMLMVNDTPYAALYSGGVYALQSGTWTQVGIGHGLPENRAFDMVVDPTDATKIYAGMMIACGTRSTDGGASWEGLCDQILSAINADNFSSDTLALDPADASTIYLAGRSSDSTRYLLKSEDAGESWTIVSTWAEEYFFNDLIFFHDRMYLGLRSGGVLISDDRGETWTTLNTGISEDGIIRFVIDEQNDRLIAAAGLFRFNIRQGGNAYVLSDDATAWTALDGPTNVTGLGVQEGTLWVGTETGEVWKEKNGTLTQTNADAVFRGFVSEFAFLSDGNILIGNAGYGIRRSTDNGKTWPLYNKGLKSMALREIAVHPTAVKRIYALTWDRFGLFASWNGGNSYTIVAPDHYFLTMATDPQDFQRIYAGKPDGFYELRVRKQRTSIIEKTAPGPSGASPASIAVHPKKSQIVLAGVSDVQESTVGYGVYRSTDGGETWKKSSGIPNNGVYSILFHPKQPSVVYAAAFGSGVYKSKDGGVTFTQIGGDALKYTYRMAMHPKKPNTLLAGSHLFFAGLSTADQISGEYGGIFKTTDGGKNWTELTGGIRDYGDNESALTEPFESWKYNFGHLPNYEQMLFDPKDADVLIVGHHGENVVMTNDNGATWTKPETGMIYDDMHNYAYCLGAPRGFKKIYTCTCGRGIFSGQYSSTDKTIQWTNAQMSDTETSPLVRSVQEARTTALSGEEFHEHSALNSHTHAE